MSGGAEPGRSVTRRQCLRATARTKADGFDILLTPDSQLRYQQNLSQRQLAIVVLS